MGWGRVRAADLPARYNAAEILEHNLADRAGKMALSIPAHESAQELTGDRALARTFAGELPEVLAVHPDLTLDGLRLIWEKNRT